MKIKCIDNKRSSIPRSITDNHSFQEDLFIEIDKEYVVYALSEKYGYVWYCILEPHSNCFPKWKPSMLFEIADPRLSRYWIFSFWKDDNSQIYPLITFPEWASDTYFYSKLGDDYFEEVETFLRYSSAMKLEFPDSSVKESAQIGDEKWLICPQCMDAWEYPDDKDALVICPMCTQIYNNPRYKNEMPVPK